MQNKCDHDGVSYVSLDGGWDCGNWICGGCGCCNCGCETCGRCGENRCGQGGVVAVGARCSRDEKRACPAEYPAQRRCDRSGCEDSCGAECASSRETHHECTRRAEEYASESPARYSTCENSECGETRQNRRSGCGAKTDARNACAAERCADSACSHGGRNRGVGMVWAKLQELDQIFESKGALCSGTLFPELHKPMSGYCPGRCCCQTDEQAAAFAAWELRLYLNTHPDDKQALALFRRLCAEANDPNYATTFLADADGSCWGWTDDPWPWEYGPCGE